LYDVSIVSRFMSDSSKLHYAAVKRILRYLQGMKNFGIKYTAKEDNTLSGYIDSGWTGCIYDRKSTSGYAFTLGSKVIFWSSRKQQTIALLYAEVEYILATSAVCEIVWLRRILFDLQQIHDSPTTLYCDKSQQLPCQRIRCSMPGLSTLRFDTISSRSSLKTRRLHWSS